MRVLAFQALFALSSNPEADIRAVCDELVAQLTSADEVVVPPYLYELVEGVITNQAQLDAEIEKYLNAKWSIARLNKTDLLILRLATYEMLFVEAVPAKVALNEALQLAKEFSDDKSRRFINGVLSNLLK
ncbi:transcription antitermination protein NusB [Ligilactobacillus agilis DSM 20509]|uniref:Transcription antitermination protein NusB n=1 Tax=Ligilactobacillus agilis DSM 20509 TaxID=1423718 RepID=A0A0R2ALE1_9LACO|nr:transcription antitermination protein NusB [Ligilactobacillus agilis DSM 20509]